MCGLKGALYNSVDRIIASMLRFFLLLLSLVWIGGYYYYYLNFVGGGYNGRGWKQGGRDISEIEMNDGKFTKNQ